jgi:hypothetical protein
MSLPRLHSCIKRVKEDVSSIFWLCGVEEIKKWHTVILVLFGFIILC